MATHRPMIVVMSASQMPAASCAALGALFSAMVRNTVTMPRMVPSRPSSGETTEMSLSQHSPFVTCSKLRWNR